jgi:hypothetical protein
MSPSAAQATALHRPSVPNSSLVRNSQLPREAKVLRAAAPAVRAMQGLASRLEGLRDARDRLQGELLNLIMGCAVAEREQGGLRAQLQVRAA